MEHPMRKIKDFIANDQKQQQTIGDQLVEKQLSCDEMFCHFRARTKAIIRPSTNEPARRMINSRRLSTSGSARSV